MDSSEETRVGVFVPTERMFEFKRQIDKIQSLARKLDLPEWEVTIAEKESRPVKVIYIEDITGRDFFKEMQLEGNSVTIVGRSPVLDGCDRRMVERNVGRNSRRGDCCNACFEFNRCRF